MKKTYNKYSTWELISLANKTRRKEAGDYFGLCSITNAKSGLCNEDCKFCAQSLHHNTSAHQFPLKNKRELLDAAWRAKKNGAKRFSIVTSGRGITAKDAGQIAETVNAIKSEVNITPCASLGIVSKDTLILLKAAGLQCYHHNIETSPDFYPNIVTTHSFEERIKTIEAAKDAGLEVCSGGIIGLGESEGDRIRMAQTLKDLNVDSVPLNMLIPIKGTPFENNHPLLPVDILRTISIFRIILSDVTIILAAGRESSLKDFQALAFLAGANGMMIGGYLTVEGRSLSDDLAMVSQVKQLWNG
ncbi:MAG: biotin synthase BioB [Pseudomonadota bacterium]